MTQYLNKPSVFRIDYNTGTRLEWYGCKAKDWIIENNNVTSEKSVMTNISRVMDGKQNSAYGYKWEYDFDDLPFEEWEPVNSKYTHGTKNIYASNLGRIKCKHIITFGTSDSKGYKVLQINNHPYKVHRLIAFAWLDNPYNYSDVDHINGCTSDNYLDNLEWVTHKENGIRAADIGLNKCRKKVYQYDKNMVLINTFKSTHEASNKTNIGQGNIVKCCLNKKGFYTAGGYIWKY